MQYLGEVLCSTDRILLGGGPRGYLGKSIGVSFHPLIIYIYNIIYNYQHIYIYIILYIWFIFIYLFEWISKTIIYIYRCPMSCDFPHGKYFWKSTKYIELLGLFMKGQWINNCKHIPKEICMNSEYIERLDLSTWSAFVFNWVILWKAFGANSLLVWVSFRHGKPCSFMFFFGCFVPQMPPLSSDGLKVDEQSWLIRGLSCLYCPTI